jgi:hypothetical protein
VSKKKKHIVGDKFAVRGLGILVISKIEFHPAQGTQIVCHFEDGHRETFSPKEMRSWTFLRNVKLNLTESQRELAAMH